MATEIPTVTLRSGATMPLLGFGTWQLEGDEAEQAVAAALEVGYRHLDTATMYGNERQVGAALRDSGVPRDDVFVTTKLPPSRARQARQTLEQSLDQLGVDAVDLWLIHWPVDGDASPETWSELLKARADGLTRAVGVSNYSLAQLDELDDATGETPEVNQIEWGPTLYDAGVVAGHRSRGVVLEGYSPFKTTNLADPVLRDIADTHGATVPQVIVRWHLQQGTVVIPKSSKRERIAANFDVTGFTLDDDEVARIDGLSGS